jgi:hypothetical protein
MPKLYIANVSTQQQIICYRLDFRMDGSRDDRPIPARQTPAIPPGRQMVVGGDLHMTQIESIVSQLEPYGLIAQMEIGRLPPHQKVSYIFNVDKEVSAETIRQEHAHNTGVKIEDGRERRQRAAVAANEIIQNTVNEQAAQAAVPVPTLKEFDISVEQDEQSEQGERRIEEGYRVSVAATPETSEPPTTARRGRGRARSTA